MTISPTVVRPCFASNMDPHAALWITRLSASILPALHKLNRGLYSEEIRQMIGIIPLEGYFCHSELRPVLKRLANELECKIPQRKNVLTRNIEMLGELLGLSKIQQQILTFVALAQQHPYLSEVIEGIRQMSLDAVVKTLSIALKLSAAEVRQAIRSDGALLSTSVIGFDRDNADRGLQLKIPSSLNASLFNATDNIKKLMKSFLEVAPNGRLSGDAFPHLTEETKLLTSYLTNAGQAKDGGGDVGINILIYGPPGTGKSEYARWLAKHLRKKLFQVKATDDEGSPISGQDRLTFFQLSQRFLQNADAIILFDEIEDVFPSSYNGLSYLLGSNKQSPGKMYINRLLEDNPVPAIWISNEVEHIDKAYLRRFDFSFEMGVPPMSVRDGILRKYLRGHDISDATIVKLSQQEKLTPSQIEKAAKVLQLSDAQGNDRESTLLQVIDNSMQLLRQDKNEALLNFGECRYQLEYLNPDCDLTQLVGQLKRAPKSVGALCFYGVPGSGKTALAHYIAREVNTPMLVRRASDILGPYVGETEQKIAAMFKQAQKAGSILLLDEADSFLTDRKLATRSWEVTAVNEMLTQMERFDGLFICSTNLMQSLDEASLRRFALKVKFDYMKPEQRWRLFCEHVPKMTRAEEIACRGTLDQFANLTPGDFATVRRQAKLFGVKLLGNELLERLRQESKIKRDGASRSIGFVN